MFDERDGVEHGRLRWLGPHGVGRDRTKDRRDQGAFPKKGVIIEGGRQTERHPLPLFYSCVTGNCVDTEG